MRSFALTAGEGRQRVAAVVVICGEDLAIHAGGGEKPHIGAVALAIPRSSLSGGGALSASASVLCVTGHKEDELARAAALRLAARFNVRVTVTAGLHIDNATAADIGVLETNFAAAISRIESTLSNELLR